MLFLFLLPLAYVLSVYVFTSALCPFENKSFMSLNMSLKLYVKLEYAQNQPETLMNSSRPADTAKSSVCESDGQLVCTATEGSLDWYSPVFH